MLFFILTGDEKVINVGSAEVKTAQGAIDEAFEGLGGRNSNEPNGVIMAVFETSSGATGICWSARTRSIVEKTVMP